MPEALDERERDILAFEARWRRHSSAKEEAIRSQLGLAPSRYYQLLGRLIDSRAALEAEPLLVRRLQRLREERDGERRRRAGRTLS